MGIENMDIGLAKEAKWFSIEAAGKEPQNYQTKCTDLYKYGLFNYVREITITIHYDNTEYTDTIDY